MASPGHNESLYPGECSFDCKCITFKYIIMTTFMGVSYAIAYRWLAEDNIGSGNGLVLSHNMPYFNQWWLRSMTPYDVTRLQWVDSRGIMVPAEQRPRAVCWLAVKTMKTHAVLSSWEQDFMHIHIRQNYSCFSDIFDIMISFCFIWKYELSFSISL